MNPRNKLRGRKRNGKPRAPRRRIPLIRQLQALGWGYIEGSLDAPEGTGRNTFAEVIQERVLRKQLYRINLRDGHPWLNEGRTSQAVGAITRVPAAKLMLGQPGRDRSPAERDQRRWPP